MLSLLLTAAIIFLSAFYSVSAVTRSNDYFGADASGAYYISFRGSRADIHCYPSGINCSLDLSYEIAAVAAGGGKTVLLSNDIPNNQMIVQTYDPFTDYLDSYAVEKMKAYENTALCYDGDCLYITDDRQTNVIRAFDNGGSLISSYSFPNSVSQLFCGYDNRIYAVSRGTLYMLNGTFEPLRGPAVSTPLSPIDPDYVSSPDGSIYDIYGSSVEYLFSAESGVQSSCGCTIDRIIYYPDGNLINGYDRVTGEKLCTYRSNNNLRLLYADGDHILAVGSDGIALSIHQNDFSRIEKPEQNDGSDIPAVEPRGEQYNADGSGISSDIYNVDLSRYIISDIPSNTTVAGFKRNMRYNSYSVQLFRDNSEKKSGNIGTAWTAVFTNSRETITFELSVNGDLTGEGNSNSRDLNVLMDYLIGAVYFNGVYSISSDMNRDGSVDVLDLALLKRSI